MSFPDKEKIGTLKENGNPELLAELDSQGLLIAPGETAAGYADRLLAEEERIGKLREKLAAEKEIDPRNSRKFSGVSPVLSEPCGRRGTMTIISTRLIPEFRSRRETAGLICFSRIMRRCWMPMSLRLKCWTRSDGRCFPARTVWTVFFWTNGFLMRLLPRS